MTPNEHDPLIRQLLELVKELDAEDIPIILGGGMSLYLRQRFLSARTPRYPFDVATRSTADLDLFLSGNLIADAPKIESLKQVIGRLDYKVIPEAKDFQFSKEVDLYGQKRTVKIDLLAAPPQAADKAFEDRKEDAESDSGRHHAYDIFATVVRMGQQDWENAKEHLAAHKGRPYMKRAAGIREKDFHMTRTL
ncbi:MAG: hypothetical protein HZB91_11570 [Elusimicrobia bacterium]|nr:hypothetical protein [Elusimicrobiota bacterium]